MKQKKRLSEKRSEVFLSFFYYLVKYPFVTWLLKNFILNYSSVSFQVSQKCLFWIFFSWIVNQALLSLKRSLLVSGGRFLSLSLYCFQEFLPSLHPRHVSSSQRGLQSPVHRGTRQRSCVFLSPWASLGLKQQDMWGGGLLQPSPEMQPSVWAIQDHSEVLLLSWMGAGLRWRQLSQYR